jgi:DNA-binding transcriptional MerR regulator
MEKLLTKEEVAEQLRRPPATLAFWRSKGLGPRSAKICGRVVYRERDVEAWIAEQFSATGAGGANVKSEDGTALAGAS